MEVVDVSLTDALLQYFDPITNEERGISSSASGSKELRNATHWREEARDLSSQQAEGKLDTVVAIGAKQNEFYQRSTATTGFCCRIIASLSFFVSSHWPLSSFMSAAFLGFWLPNKRKSIWPLTFIPVSHLLFGLGAHLYFMLSSSHRRVHIGSKMLLTALWISSFSSYVLALYYFRYQSLEWIKQLTQNQYRALNAALFVGLLLVSWVLFGDVYYQVIFDLVNIKAAFLANCTHELACNAIFYTLAVSVYWGMYSSVTVCCVFFALCLVMTNDLTRGYERISKCTGDVRDALIIHRQLRHDIADRINSIRTWFLIHMIFYMVVLLANIFEWWEATKDLDHAYQYMAQLVGTLVVAYKFFFPFIAASYVTWHESTLVQDLNDKIDFQPEETFYSRHDLEVFFQQSRRRGYGFRVFKIQITITIAIFSLLGSGFGLLHNLTKG